MTITRAEKEKRAKIKKSVLWILLSAFIMIALPFLAVKAVSGTASMAISFILFFAVNPVYSALAGFFAGKQVKTFWWNPLLHALLFVCGAWLFFDLGESAFFIYASIYLALGLIAMIITALVIKKSADKRNAILEARKKRKES